jgi:hypothetical protein
LKPDRGRQDTVFSWKFIKEEAEVNLEGASGKRAGPWKEDVN